MTRASSPKLPRLKLFLACAAMLLGSGSASAQAPAIHSDEVRRAWGFDRSDLPPHPAVRFGVLPNGLRYAVMRNGAPAGALSVRLRIDVGAGVEAIREQGFVHLIEHLIFHGTANIPEGSLPMMLSHRGLRRWTDFDAYTSYDETVFRLNLGRSDAPARQVSLLLMREIATNLMFNRSAVEGAKRKVREEIGGRDAAKDGQIAAENNFFAPNSLIDRGPVAGTSAQVARATPEALRRLYARYYVPERTALVVVGDVDPDAMVAEIAARFSDWRSSATPGRRSSATPARSGCGNKDAPVHPSSRAHRRYHCPRLAARQRGRRRRPARCSFPGAAWQPDAEPAPRRGRRRAQRTIRERRVSIYDHFNTVRLARLDVAARDRDWRGALQAGARELRRALAGGFTQAELDEQLAATRKALVRAAAPARTPELADAIIDAVGRRIVFTAPADASGTDAYLSRVRLQDVNAAFKAAWGTSDPLILVSHHRRIARGEAAIAAAWRETVPAQAAR
jgi:zinc protease